MSGRASIVREDDSAFPYPITLFSFPVDSGNRQMLKAVEAVFHLCNHYVVIL